MKKNKVIFFISAMLMLIATVLYSCNKSEITESDNTEVVLYESSIDSKLIDDNAVFLGGNTKKVTKY
jgi:hypothetical protein